MFHIINFNKFDSACQSSMPTRVPVSIDWVLDLLSRVTARDSDVKNGDQFYLDMDRDREEETFQKG